MLLFITPESAAAATMPVIHPHLLPPHLNQTVYTNHVTTGSEMMLRTPTNATAVRGSCKGHDSIQNA
jgi:hypothetical protein